MPYPSFKYLLVVLFLCVFVPFSMAQDAYTQLLEAQKNFNQANIKGDSAEIAEATYVLAKRYTYLGNYTQAQKLLLKALEIKMALKLFEDVGRIYLRMAEMEVFIDKEKALNYNRLALAYSSRANSIKGKASANRALGYNFRVIWESKDYLKKYPMALDSAIAYSEKALLLTEKLKTPIDLAESYLQMSQIMFYKDFNKSLSYKKKLLEICKQNKLYYRLIDYYIDIAKQYIIKDRLPTAKVWLDSAEYFSKKQKVINHGLSVLLLETKTSYFAKKGDWQKAYLFRDQAAQLKLNQYEEYRKDAMKTVNTAHENEIKTAQLIAHRREINLQKKNIEIQQKFTVVVTILFLVTVIASLLLRTLFIKYRKISELNAFLLNEQNHRTKNNLQTVSELLSLQLHGLSDEVAVQALQEGLLRVEAMLTIHSNLYQGEKLVEVNLQKYIPDLIYGVLRTYKFENIKTAFNISAQWLHVEQSIPLGIIINELTTNACKYAFTQNPDPSLKISCVLNAGIITFSFCDNGKGFSLESTRYNFGLKLISLLSEQLEAKEKYSFDNGCCFELSFSLKP
ncbi:sensor histidine kinase [Arcicella aquatica]|uniref:histidine kinase n=1 Tax=Arcicella aquatica TaxID=217141 RepID=A0ABU5QRZ3_9BACT|nr:sensor histidine kinase [Arcicella aquatica]MEA5259852.1 sensor histidine kinase [Arcicella aquatica]